MILFSLGKPKIMKCWKYQKFGTLRFVFYILPLTRHISCKLFPLIFSNIEDIARDAGSIDVEEDVLFRKCCLTRIIFIT